MMDLDETAKVAADMAFIELQIEGCLPVVCLEGAIKTYKWVEAELSSPHGPSLNIIREFLIQEGVLV